MARVPGEFLEAAASRLVARSNAVGGRGAATGAGRRFLEAAREHGIDVGHFFASWAHGGKTVREVCLAVPGSGSTAMYFTSNPAGEAARMELGAVVEESCRALRGTRLAQALLEPEEEGAAAGLAHGGFRRLDELIYLRRPRPAVGEFGAAYGDLPEGLSLTTWREGDDGDVKRALEDSYIGTLDCPELCGVRSTDDVLESHRATGRWEPGLWWVIREGGAARGVMLFNPCPEQQSIELVYFGLGPGLRGRGLARQLLRIGLASLERRTEKTVTCAVDARNLPARKLYERAGFTEFGRRVAMIRVVG